MHDDRILAQEAVVAWGAVDKGGKVNDRILTDEELARIFYGKEYRDEMEVPWHMIGVFHWVEKAQDAKTRQLLSVVDLAVVEITHAVAPLQAITREEKKGNELSLLRDFHCKIKDIEKTAKNYVDFTQATERVLSELEKELADE